MWNEVELPIKVRLLFLEWPLQHRCLDGLLCFSRTVCDELACRLYESFPFREDDELLLTTQRSTFRPILKWMEVDFHAVKLGDHFPEVSRLLVVLQIEVVVAELHKPLLTNSDTQGIFCMNRTDCSCRFRNVFSSSELI